MKKCGVCGSGKTVLFEKKHNINGNVNDIYVCSNCFALINGSTAENISLQEEGLNNFYRYTEEEIKKIGFYIESNKGILGGVMPFLGSIHEKTLLEIGSGRGFLLIAASQMGFNKSIGIDLNSNVFSETKKYVNVKENVTVVNDLRDVTGYVDCVVLWHTLEHIYDPNLFFKNLRPKMNRGCILYIQVPQYHQPYICDTHYYFYTEPSIRILFSNNGFETLSIGYDLTNQFMSVIARYTAQSAAA